MTTETDEQTGVDAGNAEFWDELCGSALARQIGVTGGDPESLARFDAAYLGLYPYLSPYYDSEPLLNKRVLEIGLGYGTLSEQLARKGAEYHGVDIAAGPVQMVRHRLEALGAPAGDRVRQASALQLPFEDGSFDYVFSIGCLHHTGDLARAIAEVSRVLSGGGKAIVMLYNRDSYRQLRTVRIPALLRRGRSAQDVRGMYDANAAGDAAPHTDYVSRGDIRRLFSAWSDVRIEARNFDSLPVIARERLLGTIDRLLGLDLYIVATK